MNITLTITYQSSLAAAMRDFVRSKKLAGYDYDQPARKLKVFDSFLVDTGFCGQRLHREIIEDYIAASRKAQLHPNALYARVSIVRQFSRYLAHDNPDSYVIASMPVSQAPNRRPYLYSRQEIHQLMEAANNLQPKPAHPLRPHTFSTLIGLLYACGLRLGEALSLRGEHIDCQRQRLFIHQGKFGKDRWVAISESTVEALANHLNRSRKAVCTRGKQAPLLADGAGKELGQHTVRAVYRKLLSECQISRNTSLKTGVNSQSQPCLHDLRHTFAVERLLEAYATGKDPNALLPVLATYMGHRNISSTQVYLHTTEELRQETSKRFGAYARPFIPTTHY